MRFPKITKYQKKTINPKIIEKIDLLLIRDDFKNDIRVFYKNWSKTIKEKKRIEKKYIDYLYKIYKKYQKLDNFKAIYEALNDKERKKLDLISSKRIKCKFGNEDFEKELAMIAEKYKLYPVQMWRKTLLSILTRENFISLPFTMKDSDIRPRDIYNDIKKKNFPINFSIQIQRNYIADEPQLKIILFEDTSLKDLKSAWHIIADLQKKLKKIKKIERRYYPHKNINIAKKLSKLDKKETSDWIKQEEIYGEINDLDFGTEEKKRKNRIKQIRYRYKK